MYPKRVVLACLARTGCINAAMTARGMQQIGLAFVLEPALRQLYPEPQAFARAMERYRVQAELVKDGRSIRLPNTDGAHYGNAVRFVGWVLP